MPSRSDAITRLLGIPNHDVAGLDQIMAGTWAIHLQRRRRVLKCPKCRRVAPCYDSIPRFIDDLPAWGQRIVLVVALPRVNCPTCGVLRVTYHWIGPSARRTRRYERRIFDLTRWIPVSDVADLTRLAWDTVKEIEKRYIRGALRTRDLDGIQVLGFDEVSYRKGHRYLTIVTDIARRRVIGVEKGRDSAALRRFFRGFGATRLAQIREVVIDMHDPYEKAIREAIPHAVVVYDRFHLMKLLNESLDEVRRRLQREMPPQDRAILKNKRYVLLKARENLTPKQIVALQELQQKNRPLSTAYLLKEDFREIYQAQDVASARRGFAGWIRRARQSDVPEMFDFVRTLRRRMPGVLAFFRYGHRLTAGLSEGINNVIATIKKVAYGIRDLPYLSLKIQRHCGKLHLPSHALPTAF